MKIYTSMCVFLHKIIIHSTPTYII